MGEIVKKLKKIWRNNKIVIILCIILLICLCTIGYVALTYFFGGSDSAYGSRLDGIEDYAFSSSDLTDIENLIEEDEKVLSASVEVIGKILHITVNFYDEAGLEEAKKIAASSLSFFEEDYLNYYDCNYIVTSESFTLMAYKNSTSTSLVWNNETEFDSESE